MLLDKICRTCRRSFMGGPRAWYCPECRHERKKNAHREHKRKKKLGLTRAIGSIDTCKYCGKEYEVKGGLQEMCEDCKPVMYAIYDRKSSLEFYRENKENINPLRNKKRRIGTRKCEICGKEFESKTKSLTCSAECRRMRINKKWNERYHKNKPDSK